MSTRGNVNNDFHDKHYADIFQGVFQHSPNGIIVTNKDLIIELFNGNAEKLSGMKKEDAIGHFILAVPFSTYKEKISKNKY